MSGESFGWEGEHEAPEGSDEYAFAVPDLPRRTQRDGEHVEAQAPVSYTDASGNELPSYEMQVQQSGLSDAEQAILLDRQRQQQETEARLALGQTTTEADLRNAQFRTEGELLAFMRARGMNA